MQECLTTILFLCLHTQRPVAYGLGRTVKLREGLGRYHVDFGVVRGRVKFILTDHLRVYIYHDTFAQLVGVGMRLAQIYNPIHSDKYLSHLASICPSYHFELSHLQIHGLSFPHDFARCRFFRATRHTCKPTADCRLLNSRNSCVCRDLRTAIQTSNHLHFQGFFKIRPQP